MGYLNKVENPDTLKMIINRLPYRLKLKWRGVADRINQTDNFVTPKARAATPSLEMLQRTTQYLLEDQSSEASYPLRPPTLPSTQSHSRKPIHQLILTTRNVLFVMADIGCPIEMSLRRNL